MILSELKILFRHRHLLLALAKRDVLGEVKGSLLGIYWSLLEPLILLVIYTVVFHYLLGIRIGGEANPRSFALYLFCGLVPFLSVSQAINRSTTIIRENKHLIRKIIFPSEVLPLNLVLSALVRQGFGFLILIGAVALLPGRIGWPLLLLPLLLIPQILLTAGISWLVASLSVFVRDTRQIVSLLMVAWMFLTPIFYDETYTPRQLIGFYRAWLFINPLADLLAGYRSILLEGEPPDLVRVAIASAMGICSFLTGLWWFSRSKKAFVDVL